MEKVYIVEYYYYDTVYNTEKAYLNEADAKAETDKLNRENPTDAHWEYYELRVVS